MTFEVPTMDNGTCFGGGDSLASLISATLEIPDPGVLW
jgi:hypothetical protein